MDGRTDRQTNRQTDRQTDRQERRLKGRQVNRQKEKRTSRRAGRLAGRETGQTDIDFFFNQHHKDIIKPSLFLLQYILKSIIAFEYVNIFTLILSVHPCTEPLRLNEKPFDTLSCMFATLLKIVSAIFTKNDTDTTVFFTVASTISFSNAALLSLNGKEIYNSERLMNYSIYLWNFRVVILNLYFIFNLIFIVRRS